MNSRSCSIYLLSLLVVWMVFPQTFSLAENKLAAVDPSMVKVGGEMGRRIDITINNNLLVIDVDKDFLDSFRQKKVIEKSAGTERYVGLGKLIDASITFAVHTRDPRIIRLKEHLVNELIKTQLADGYMGVFQPEHRVSAYWDLHEMVYLIHGLVADYEHFGNKRSLEAAQKLGDYILRRRKCTGQPRLVGKLNTERAFIALFRATGDKKYLDYAVDGMDLRNWSPPVRGHVYTFINVCMAQLDLYEIEPNKKLLGQSRKVIDFMTARDGLHVSGVCTTKEGFCGDQTTTGPMGETCATAYLIRLLHTMLCIEGDSNYGDLMERVIYNGLFAAQLPDGRRLRYFTPVEGKRTVYEGDTYCCPNNFRRIIAELPQMIYYRVSDGGVAVNLYTSSSTTISLDKDVKLDVLQETDYPNSGKVVVRLDPSQPVGFSLRLRIPAWCEKATVAVNGQKLDQPAKKGRFFTVDRVWKPGDRVELDLPMEWRLVRGRKLKKGRVAVLRGPMLFCLAPNRLVAMNPALAKHLNAVDEKSRQSRLDAVVSGLRLDPQSLGRAVEDSTVRPGGLSCPARAWSPTASVTEPPDLKILLTEFADPEGELTYFRMPDTTTTVEDELVRH